MISENSVADSNLSRFKGKRLTLMPWLESQSGYCIHALQYFRHWEKLDVFVSIRPVQATETEEVRVPMELKRAIVNRDQPEPWEVILSPASHVPAGRRKSVYYSMYESSRWTPRQVKLLNRSDAIIVGSEWNRFGLRESGCIRPIYVVPLGYSEESFKSTPIKMDGPCVFGAAGRMSHGAIRKGLNAVIECFTKEFKNEKDVQLQVKGFQDCPTHYVCDSRIVVREGYIKEKALADWYSNLTCFVSAARGEGFGLMQLESMASGRPVIASIYGGLREFMTPENSYAVDFKESPSEEAWSNGGLWAVPDENHIRHLMRQVYNHRQHAQTIGIRAALDVKEFTWKNSALRCLETLESIGAI